VSCERVIHFGGDRMKCAACWLACAFWFSGTGLAWAAQPSQDAPSELAPGGLSREAERDYFTDRGIEALADGDLGLAELTLAAAAELPGDPARRAASAFLLARVRELRARRGRPGVAPVPRRRVVRPAASAASARAPLIAFTTLLGLGLYGWTLPRTLNIDPTTSTRAFVGTYMLTVAASFAVPYVLTAHSPVGPASVNLAFYGGTRGIWHGILVGALIAGDLTPDRRPRGWAASMLVGSLAELIAGYHLAPVLAPTAGRAHTIAVLGDFGLLLGFGTGYLLHYDQKDTADAQARSMAAAGLVGAGLGLAGGYALAATRDNSWGDGEVLRLCWALGAWNGVAAADLAHTDLSLGNRTFTGLAMAGGALGLLAGDRLVRDADFTVGESLLIDLATIAGGLLGAGVAYLIIQDYGPYQFASGLGGLMGFGLSYWLTPGRVALAGRPRDRQAGTLTLAPLLGVRGAKGLALAGAF
jgi:hypothetical protein